MILVCAVSYNMDYIILSLALMLIWPSEPGFYFNLRDMYRSRHGPPPSSSDFTDSWTSSRCRHNTDFHSKGHSLRRWPL
ncbi:hypothetical protein BDZ89DRAFT_1162653 [Hymenopellis radicata]|nr:hypothetical protein BDZ89DRAFT_1162653 [Hymenopellis radicata]